ncbi:MAG TPA: hypothetical protein PKA05_19930 [Roseiflexaceae bacterium]|nr:hypothetical protein [Roseiflexaceae bacterium]HMP42659.1 hypothetical protein [Roseiflexaceae bacterium]
MSIIRTIGSRLEPLVDDYLIDTMQGVSLRLHSPVLRETVLTFDRPWEGPVSFAPNVRRDGERFRMWYRAGGDADQRLAYAESTDGINWERPNLGLVEYQGSRENNILLEGSHAQGVSVFIDENPAAAADARYKAIGIGPKIDGRATLRGFASPDGLRWHMVIDPLLVAPDDGRPWFDSQNLAYWNSHTGRYELYARGWVPPRIRWIRRSLSDDFANWSELEFIDAGETPFEHLYENSTTPYFRAPHILLAFPKRFVPERKVRADWFDGLSDAVFMASRDGLHWDRRFMEAFLRPGPDPDNWTERNMYVGPGIVETGPAELSLYVVEHYRHPTAHIRRVTLRTDGFVSANAGYAGGELTTHPLNFAGNQLTINYATSAVGSVRVEVQEAAGRPIAGYTLDQSSEIYGDEIAHVVSWHSGAEIGALAGRSIRLRFVMKDADLYAIRFRE